MSERVITLDREVLRLGKYTSGYDNLTHDQVHGLLWILGEWATRAREDGSYQGSDERGKAALEALRTFKSRPLTLEEAKALIRDVHPVSIGPIKPRQYQHPISSTVGEPTKP